MNIKEAVYGLKQDIYNLKDFLSDTEKQIWQEATETVLAELEKKDTIINTMQAEFERLEDLEDNTDMLKMELKKKNNIIDFMAKRIKEDSEWFYSDLDNKNENEIKEYFKKKVEE